MNLILYSDRALELGKAVRAELGPDAEHVTFIHPDPSAPMWRGPVRQGPKEDTAALFDFQWSDKSKREAFAAFRFGGLAMEAKRCGHDVILYDAPADGESFVATNLGVLLSTPADVAAWITDWVTVGPIQYTLLAPAMKTLGAVAGRVRAKNKTDSLRRCLQECLRVPPSSAEVRAAAEALSVGSRRNRKSVYMRPTLRERRFIDGHASGGTFKTANMDEAVFYRGFGLTSLTVSGLVEVGGWRILKEWQLLKAAAAKA